MKHLTLHLLLIAIEVASVLLDPIFKVRFRISISYGGRNCEATCLADDAVNKKYFNREPIKFAMKMPENWVSIEVFRTELRRFTSKTSIFGRNMNSGTNGEC